MGNYDVGGSAGKVCIFFTNGGMLFLGEGVCDINMERGRCRSEIKDDIARHFNRPEYAIQRPPELIDWLWKGERSTSDDALNDGIRIGGFGLSSLEFQYSFSYWRFPIWRINGAYKRGRYEE